MKDLFKNPLFQIGLALRLFLLFFLFEGPAKELFIPFLDAAVSNLGSNPWNLMEPKFFPYGGVAFLILFLPKLLGSLVFGSQALGTAVLSVVLFKLPLLVLDLVLLRSLLRMGGSRQTQILIFYWLNPVLIYITFIMGQLDLISITFLFLSLAHLSAKRYSRSGAFAALSVASKFHVFLLIPVMMAYIWNANFVQKARASLLKFLGALAGILLLAYVPIILSDSLGYVSVGSPEAQRIFALQAQLQSGIHIYFGVALVILLLGRIVLAPKLTEDGVFYGAACLLGSLLLVTDPFANWYFWIFPFLALFFSSYAFSLSSLFWVIIMAYFGHFVVAPNIENVFPLLGKLSFTALQVTLAGILFLIWYIVIQKELPLERRLRPLLIGMAGNSGAGKNTLSNVLMDIFGHSTTQIVEGDDYHKWERGHDKWQDYTHLNPRANDLRNLALHTAHLLLGKMVFQPHYDHRTGTFTPPRLIKPTKTVLVQGLHTFYLKKMRDLFDIKIFLKPDERIRYSWKIKRDVKERGYDLQKVLNSLRSREADSQVHIDPQAEAADLVVELKTDPEITMEMVQGGREAPVTQLDLVLTNDAPIYVLIEELAKIKTLKTSIAEQSNEKVRLSFQGQVPAIELEQICHRMYPSLRHLTRAYESPQIQADFMGLVQVFILALTAEKA